MRNPDPGFTGRAMVLLPFLLAASCAQPREAGPGSSPGGDVRVFTDAGRTIVEVRSPKGIGSATVQLTAAECALPVRFRFHLDGLERFLLRYASTTLELSLPAPGLDRPPLVEATVDGVRVPDAADDPRFHMGIDEGMPIEISAPPHFAAGACVEFSMEWVDFYRR